jgi:ketosteroid isomerase-like protein
MSARNVELHRRWFEAFNAHDIEAQIAFYDQGVEFHSVFEAVGGATYFGHDGIRRNHKDLQEAWGAEIRLDAEAFFDLGEHTLAFYVYRARGHQSGAKVAMPAAAVARWRDGLITHVTAYSNREDALRDLGVTGDDLERIDP